MMPFLQLMKDCGCCMEGLLGCAQAWRHCVTLNRWSSKPPSR